MWLTGLSWTKGHWEKATDDKGNFVRELYVCAGPFFFNRRWIYVYVGARPTVTWVEGYGDEGYLGFIARWMKRHGFGNYGVAIRLPKQ